MFANNAISYDKKTSQVVDDKRVINTLKLIV